ncbi:hypothetical protein [Streptococcus sp. zg-JUN1979]|uniref:hypothetical protein n=1 Tax=Streptococcus sp. zg-JUN1979 TaxID=3391450 RepID=UPI0039A4860A
MRKFLQTTLYELSFYVEILISIILVLVLILLTSRLVIDATDIYAGSSSIESYLQDFINQAMSIAIGVELIKMLSKHTSGTIIEVLLFAAARQIVVSHGSTLDMLLGVLAIAALFATRKYLFADFDDSTNIIVRGSQKVKIANVIARVNLRGYEEGELLRDFVARHLKADDKTVSIGASVYFPDVVLRVDNVRQGVITRIEIIKSIH